MKVIRRRWNDQRGTALISLILVFGALTAMMVLAVDVGRAMFTATEVQTAAETAATGGVRALLAGGSAQAGATLLIGQNRIDGQAATVSNLPLVETGNFTNGSFNSGGAPANAVRAFAQKTVNNIMAGILGSASTNVQLSATAAFSSLGGGTPTLPLAIGDCAFTDPNCYSNGCLPSLTQIPAGSDDSGWTAFFSNTSTQTVQQYFSSDCGGTTGATAPFLEVDDVIGLGNGQNLSPLLGNPQRTTGLACMFDHGLRTFLVPVVSCGAFNQTGTVQGFATIVIDAVVTQGNNKYMNVHATFNAGVPGPPGGGNFGTGFAALVG